MKFMITNPKEAIRSHSPIYLNQSTKNKFDNSLLCKSINPRTPGKEIYLQSSASKPVIIPNELKERFDKSREQLNKSFSQKESIILTKVKTNLIDMDNKSLIFEQSLKKVLLENQDYNSRHVSPNKNHKDISNTQINDNYTIRRPSPLPLCLRKSRLSSDAHSPMKIKLSDIVKSRRMKSKPKILLSDKFRSMFPFQRRNELIKKIKMILTKLISTNKALKEISNEEIFPKSKFAIANSKKFFLSVKASDIETVKSMLKSNPNFVYQFDDVNLLVSKNSSSYCSSKKRASNDKDFG
jgi:hypothetical protein